MKTKRIYELVLVCVAGMVLGGSGFLAAVGQEGQNRQDRPEFTQRGQMERTQRPGGASSSGERYGYTSYQGAYAPMGEGNNGSWGAGVFSAGTPIPKFHKKVDLTFYQHGEIAGVSGDIYKSMVGGKEYYLLFSDYVFSDGYARVVVWREGLYTIYSSSRTPQA